MYYFVHSLKYILNDIYLLDRNVNDIYLRGGVKTVRSEKGQDCEVLDNVINNLTTPNDFKKLFPTLVEII